MATLISTFREPIRVIIDDNDPDIQLREDAQLDAAVRTVVDLGKVTGALAAGTTYEVDALRTGITPNLTAAGDPKAFAQVVYHTAKLFLGAQAPTSWRTRAFSETIGRNYEAVWNVLTELWDVESGEGCESSEYPE